MMLFPEEDAAQLKTWIVKRIENTSDADSDVLADYVIALLKHDGDEAAIRKLCEKEIPDFLTEDSKAFLDDVFQALTYKSYMPGAPPVPNPTPKNIPKPLANLPPKPSNSRKRGFEESQDVNDQNGYTQRGERAHKQPRRGGRRNESFGAYMQRMDTMNVPPFDTTTNPMEVFMRMQAIGMPFPGMPDYSGQALGSRQHKRGRCRDFDSKGFCSRGSTCVYDHGQEPDAAGDYSMGGGFMDMAQIMSHGPQFLVDAPRGGRGGRGGKRTRGGKGPKGTRSTFSADGPINDRSKSTIVVENIPEENLSDDQVRNFFAQFGNIQEVSMQPYKHLAVIKYDNWDEASAAYNSPKVIFDNRFVKVFWHKEELDRASQRGSRSGARGAREGSNGGDIGQTEELDSEEFQRRQEEAQKSYEERESKRSELELKRQDLEKQQQELLAKHRAETERLQAKLLAKSGRGDNGVTSDENGASTGSTDMLRAKLALLEQEAKILGIEPEVSNVEDSGSIGGFRGGYRGRGNRGRGTYARGGYAPRGRGSLRGNGARHAAYAQFSIDNRPKKVAIAGADFATTEKNEALRHFLISNGEFESVESGVEKTTVSFPDRKTAEKFYFSLQGKELPGVSGNLELSWVNTPLPPVAAGGSSSFSVGPSATGKAAGESEAVGGDFGNMGDGVEEYTGASAAKQDEPKREVNMDYEMPDEEAW